MSQPYTRDLSTVVDALSITLAELEFTATRLENKLRTQRADTDQETDHLEDLVRGYRSAQHYLEILWRYQRGRLTRQRSPSGSALPAGPDIDAAGRGRAHVTDEESPV